VGGATVQNNEHKEKRLRKRGRGGNGKKRAEKGTK